MTFKGTQKRTKVDAHQKITDRIIASIERGSGPWSASWTSCRPRNGSTNAPYRGINTLLLWARADEAGFKAQEWYTYNQAKKLDGQVRKGEVGECLAFYKPSSYAVKDNAGKPVLDNDGNIELRSYFYINTFTVFNVDQIDGIEPKASPEGSGTLIHSAEDIIYGSGAQFTSKPGDPAYLPSSDQIRMPERGAFQSLDSYYSVMFHEMTHWSGAEHRLNRDMSGSNHNSSYAKEEIVAELGSAFLCADSGVAFQYKDHASYINGWLSALGGDKRFALQAASKASKAADYLFGMGLDYRAKIEAEPTGPCM